MKTIFVIAKNHITKTHIPTKLKGGNPLIKEYEVIKRTGMGYRLSVNYAREKGSMYLDAYYEFFPTYKAAVEFIASEANKVAAEFEQLKLQAIQLMCEAHDELHSVEGAK